MTARVSKAHINTSPVADIYAAPGEKIIEFSSPGGGGLISFMLLGNGDGTQRLRVDVYRTDDTVEARCPSTSSADSALSELQKAAREVVGSWESGDLAAAVRRLSAALGSEASDE